MRLDKAEARVAALTPHSHPLLCPHLPPLTLVITLTNLVGQSVGTEMRLDRAEARVADWMPANSLVAWVWPWNWMWPVDWTAVDMATWVRGGVASSRGQPRSSTYWKPKWVNRGVRVKGEVVLVRGCGVVLGEVVLVGGCGVVLREVVLVGGEGVMR